MCWCGAVQFDARLSTLRKKHQQWTLSIAQIHAHEPAHINSSSPIHTRSSPRSLVTHAYTRSSNDQMNRWFLGSLSQSNPKTNGSLSKTFQYWTHWFSVLKFFSAWNSIEIRTSFLSWTRSLNWIKFRSPLPSIYPRNSICKFQISFIENSLPLEIKSRFKDFSLNSSLIPRDFIEIFQHCAKSSKISKDFNFQRNFFVNFATAYAHIHLCCGELMWHVIECSTLHFAKMSQSFSYDSYEKRTK